MSAAAAPTRSVGRGGKSDILHHPITRSVLPFLNGGAAGMIATSVIQPVDMVKVCVQLSLFLCICWVGTLEVGSWEREDPVSYHLGPVRVGPAAWSFPAAVQIPLTLASFLLVTTMIDHSLMHG